jgi:hypothetical protein
MLHYGVAPHDQRIFSDELRRLDKKLYDRLTVAMTRNGTRGLKPDTLADIMRVHRSEITEENAFEKLTRSRNRSRTSMAALRRDRADDPS